MAGLLSTQLNPTTSTGQFIGDALSGLGAGLLAYGGGGYLRPQAGMIGLQALQAAPQVRQERLMQNLQYQLGNQQLQQARISNAINNAVAVGNLNWYNRELNPNAPLVSMDQFSADPNAYVGAYAGTPSAMPQMPSAAGQPSGGVLSGTASGQPQPLPAGGMLKTGANYQMPSMPQQTQQAPAQMSPQSSPLVPQMAQGAPQAASPQPQGGPAQANGYDILIDGVPLSQRLQKIQFDALHNPEYAKIEKETLLARPDVQFITKLMDKNQTLDANGNIMNYNGAVQAGAQVTGANAAATAQGQLPAELSKIYAQGGQARQTEAFKIAHTPLNVRAGSAIVQFGPDGKPVATYQNPIPVEGVNPQTGAPTKQFVTPAVPAQGNAAGNANQPYTTGLPPGQSTVYDKVISRDTALRDLGVGTNDRINMLQQLSDLSKDTKFGTGRETQYTWEKLAQIIPGVTLGQDDATNMDIFKKFVANLGRQYQMAMGGTGTDRQLEVAMDALPSTDKLSSAIQKIVPYMVSQEEAIKGQLNAREAWKANNGDNAASLLKFENTWRNVYDPRVYQFMQMEPDQQKQFLSTLKPADRDKFLKSGQALESLGAIQ